MKLPSSFGGPPLFISPSLSAGQPVTTIASVVDAMVVWLSEYLTAVNCKAASAAMSLSCASACSGACRERVKVNGALFETASELLCWISPARPVKEGEAGRECLLPLTSVALLTIKF